MTNLQNKRKERTEKQWAKPFKTAFIIFFAAVFLPFGEAKAVSSRTFDAMYAAAARGDVPSLREAMHRGLRIDAVNRSGDTGVCAAVKRRDYRAYNAFIQAGARANPPCLARIGRAEYEEFINSDEIVIYARNQYTPPAGQPAPGGYYSSSGYVSDRQMGIIQRELDYTAQTGNVYNLLYLPVSLLFSFFP